MTEMIDLDAEGKLRQLTVDDVTFIIEQRDPYGFCHITIPGRKVPEALEGAFTSFTEAERHINMWDSNKKLGKKASDDLPVAPASVPATKTTKKVKAALETE